MKLLEILKLHKKGNPMTNLPSEEIRRKIRDIEDKINDCKAYISSDFCVSCNEMYNNIKKYEAEIAELKLKD
jgi:hypothetical protein